MRSYLVDWPLGSHATPVGPDADLSPLGVARLVNEVIDALGLHDVTLVGNDTGGAICQLLLADDASRIGRVVLTNCDAFENFPPRMFVPLFLAAKRTWLTALLLAPMRFRVVRNSPLAYGLLMKPPRDNALTRRWIMPALTDRRIRADIARFTRGVDRNALVEAAPRLRNVSAPARIVWGTDDRNFTLETGRRLAAAFADGELIEVQGAADVRVPGRAPCRGRRHRRPGSGRRSGAAVRARRPASRSGRRGGRGGFARAQPPPRRTPRLTSAPTVPGRRPRARRSMRANVR